MFLKISQNSQGNTFTRVPFLMKLQAGLQHGLTPLDDSYSKKIQKRDPMKLLLWKNETHQQVQRKEQMRKMVDLSSYNA